MPGAVGEMGVQPLLEHLPQFQRQPQQDVAGMAGAGLGRGLQDFLHLGIVQRRDHRRRQHPGRHARPGQFGDRRAGGGPGSRRAAP